MCAESGSAVLVYSSLSVPPQVERVYVVLGTNDGIPSLLERSTFRMVQSSCDGIDDNLFDSNRLSRGASIWCPSLVKSI